MQLPPESERPHKVVPCKNEDGTITVKKIKLTNKEWTDHLNIQKEAMILQSRHDENKNLYQREEEYQLFVYPLLNRALCLHHFENDNSLLRELNDKWYEIKQKYPDNNGGHSEEKEDV